jgi:hypothetical protein
MSQTRIVDHDPFYGVTTHFEDKDDGGFELHYTTADVSSNLELNKAKQRAGREYYAADPDMWKVASIPILVQFKWLTEKGVDVNNPDHWPAVQRLLNDPDWRYLKTAEVII